MKLVQFWKNNAPALGIQTEKGIVDAAAEAAVRGLIVPQTMLELIDGKSVKMNHGDKRWKAVGPMFLRASVTVDDEKGTFVLTPLYS